MKEFTVREPSHYTNGNLSLAKLAGEWELAKMVNGIWEIEYRFPEGTPNLMGAAFMAVQRFFTETPEGIIGWIRWTGRSWEVIDIDDLRMEERIL